MSKLIVIRQILESLYSDKSAGELINILEEHELFQLLRKTETQLNELISGKEVFYKKFKVIPIGPLIANLLICANTRLKSVPEQNRLDLEQLMSDITLSVLKEISNRFNTKRFELFDHIGFALEKTCEFQDYDKYQLLAYLRLDQALSYKSALQTGEKIKTYIPKLTWNGNSKEFNSFIEIFFDRSLLNKGSKFARMFAAPEEPLHIIFNAEKADVILQLLAFGVKKKRISASPSRSIYEVLTYHVLDFQDKILKNKSPRLRMNSLKCSKIKWARNQDLIDKWTIGVY